MCLGLLFWSRDGAYPFFFGETKHGLRFYKESEKTGYFLYVPPSFTQARKWPLIVGLAEWGTKTKTYIKRWTAEADKRGYIVLCPNWWKAKDVLPEPGDQWLLKIIRKVCERYNIDPKRILLTGFADGGDYASYLALRYPRRFSALASVGGALLPTYDNLIYYGRVTRHPLPFFFMHGKGDIDLKDRFGSLDEVEKAVEKLKRRNLDVAHREIEGLGHEYRNDFNSQILDWFESKARFRGVKV